MLVVIVDETCQPEYQDEDEEKHRIDHPHEVLAEINLPPLRHPPATDLEYWDDEDKTQNTNVTHQQHLPVDPVLPPETGNKLLCFAVNIDKVDSSKD